MKHLLAFTTLLTMFLIAELVSRSVWPRTNSSCPWHIPDETLSHRVQSRYDNIYTLFPDGHRFTVRTGDDGFRDPPDALSLYKKRKVLFVGDSFTFGYGVEESFPYLVGQFDPRIVPINAGVSGYGMLQTITLMREAMTRYRPQTIVYTFCGNDLHDDRRFLMMKTTWMMRTKNLFRQYSNLYRVAVAKVKNHMKVSNGGYYDDQTGCRISEDDWRDFTVRLMLMSLYAEDTGARFMVQCSKPWDRNISDRVRRACELLGIEYVWTDMDPEFRKIGADKHWNMHGHWVVAEKLTRRLNG